MASTASNQKPVLYQLDERADHSTVVVNDSLFLWAGNQSGLPKVHDSTVKRRVFANVDIFSLSTGKWITKVTTGVPPLGVMGYACDAIGNKLYYFGGYCRHDNCYHNSINQLDTTDLKWTELSPTDPAIPVMRRGWGGMLTTEHAGTNYLLMIAGRGEAPSIRLYDTRYVEFNTGRWRTNEHSTFNLSTGEWSNPTITGQCIQATSHCVIEQINNNRAILFGGLVDKDTRSNDVYILDITFKTVCWQSLKPPHLDHWPVGRWSHAGTIITGSISPILLTIGGWDQHNQTLSDCWLFVIESGTMRKIPLPQSVSDRYAHSLSVFVMGPRCVWLLVVGGGNNKGTYIPPPDSTVLVELIFKQGQWTVGDILDSTALTTENYQQKYFQQVQSGRREWAIEYKKLQEEKESNVLRKNDNFDDNKRELQHVREQLEEMEGILRISLKQLQDKEKSLETANQQIAEKETALRVSYEQMESNERISIRQLEEKNRKVRLCRDQLRAHEENIQVIRRQLRIEKDRNIDLQRELQEREIEFRKQLEEKEEEKNELVRQKERRLPKVISGRDINPFQHENDHWMIKGEEVIMTEEFLGRGAFANVNVGIFRGLRIAVKTLHQVIISDFNLALFTREMNISSKLRHPNLVQFIGATDKAGNPLILSELMTISLQKLIEQGSSLRQSQIISISRDVALGLNYLHLWKPDPIIHRDVSSPNVLLEPSSNGNYKAKVGDYGTATLQMQTLTIMPGNMAYAAPEAVSPNSHSPAMDVYSYSVLLIVMNLKTLPGLTKEEKHKQVEAITWSPIRSLIQRGLSDDQHARPKMRQILDDLKRIAISQENYSNV